MTESVTSKLDLDFVLKNGALKGPHLLIRIFPPDEMTAGGIVIPSTHTKNRKIAEIVKVGDELPHPDDAYDPDGANPHPGEVFEVGDTVWFTAHAAQNIPELGEDIFHIHSRDVVIHVKKEHMHGQA